MIVEALFAVKQNSKWDVGTVITIKPVGKSYANKQEALNETDPTIRNENKRILERIRNRKDLDKIEEEGYDTNWGRLDQRYYGIAKVDVLDNFVNNFVPEKNKFAMSVFPDELINRWRNPTLKVNLDRVLDTTFVFSKNDIRRNSLWEDPSLEPDTDPDFIP